MPSLTIKTHGITPRTACYGTRKGEFIRRRRWAFDCIQPNAILMSRTFSRSAMSCVLVRCIFNPSLLTVRSVAVHGRRLMPADSFAAAFCRGYFGTCERSSYPAAPGLGCGAVRSMRAFLSAAFLSDRSARAAAASILLMPSRIVRPVRAASSVFGTPSSGRSAAPVRVAAADRERPLLQTASSSGKRRGESRSGAFRAAGRRSVSAAPSSASRPGAQFRRLALMSRTTCSAVTTRGQGGFLEKSPLPFFAASRGRAAVGVRGPAAAPVRPSFPQPTPCALVQAFAAAAGSSCRNAAPGGRLREGSESSTAVTCEWKEAAHDRGRGICVCRVPGVRPVRQDGAASSRRTPSPQVMEPHRRRQPRPLHAEGSSRMSLSGGRRRRFSRSRERPVPRRRIRRSVSMDSDERKGLFRHAMLPAAPKQAARQFAWNAKRLEGRP